MRTEHVAFQVEKPVDVVAWYVKHLGFKVLRADTTGVQMHFIADESGKMVIELYNNPTAKVPDYKSQSHFVLHLAFVANDIRKDRDRLIAAGATEADPLFTTPGGDELVMLRDPFGFCIQLTNRKKPML